METLFNKKVGDCNFEIVRDSVSRKKYILDNQRVSKEVFRESLRKEIKRSKDAKPILCSKEKAEEFNSAERDFISQFEIKNK